MVLSPRLQTTRQISFLRCRFAGRCAAGLRHQPDASTPALALGISAVFLAAAYATRLAGNAGAFAFCLTPAVILFSWLGEPAASSSHVAALRGADTAIGCLIALARLCGVGATCRAVARVPPRPGCARGQRRLPPRIDQRGARVVRGASTARGAARGRRPAPPPGPRTRSPNVLPNWTRHWPPRIAPCTPRPAAWPRWRGCCAPAPNRGRSTRGRCRPSSAAGRFGGTACRGGRPAGPHRCDGGGGAGPAGTADARRSTFRPLSRGTGRLRGQPYRCRASHGGPAAYPGGGTGAGDALALARGQGGMSSPGVSAIGQTLATILE